MTDERIEAIRSSAAAVGTELSQAQAGQMLEFYERMTEKNRVMNLTAITDFDEALTKHFADSLALTMAIEPEVLRRSGPVIDVGTGAGFPGLPLKIAYPELDFLLADSLQKRLTFLDEVIGALGLQGITTRHGRAEDLGRDSALRGHFGLCVSRAVANLSVLAEYCLPFVRTGGLFVAYKAQAGEEVREAAGAIRKLGGKVREVREITLPGTDIGRCFVMIEKEKPTPDKYPRKAGLPAKEPLK